jgi:hypothetical protein
MREFKFFDENPKSYDGASWIYGRLENLEEVRYNIITENHYGIHSFLNNFPSWFIIPILSITGPNGIVHNSENEGIGWGFDITSDLITIEWIRYIN